MGTRVLIGIQVPLPLFSMQVEEGRIETMVYRYSTVHETFARHWWYFGIAKPQPVFLPRFKKEVKKCWALQLKLVVMAHRKK